MLDMREAKKDLRTFLKDNRITVDDWDLFFKKHFLGRHWDFVSDQEMLKNILVARNFDQDMLKKIGLAGLIEIRELEFAKTREWQRIVERNKGKKKAAGAVGEMEIMQAYVNSRKAVLNFQRVLSPHSISFQFPLEPSKPFMTTTVTSVDVHRCEKIKAKTYECMFDMNISSSLAKGFGSSNDAYLKMMSRMMKNQSYSKAKAVFTNRQVRWLSPTFIKEYQQALKRFSDSAQEYQDRMDELTVEDPFGPN